MSYASPGSQHLVLGPRTPSSAEERLSVADLDAAVFRIARALLLESGAAGG